MNGQDQSSAASLPVGIRKTSRAEAPGIPIVNNLYSQNRNVVNLVPSLPDDLHVNNEPTEKPLEGALKYPGENYDELTAPSPKKAVLFTQVEADTSLPPVKRALYGRTVVPRSGYKFGAGVNISRKNTKPNILGETIPTLYGNFLKADAYYNRESENSRLRTPSPPVTVDIAPPGLPAVQGKLLVSPEAQDQSKTVPVPNNIPTGSGRVLVSDESKGKKRRLSKHHKFLIIDPKKRRKKK